MVDVNFQTVLTLSAVGVPPYSARGLRQTLEPISGSGQMRRTVNGLLRDLSHAQFRKYATQISGEDVQPPALDFVWPGRVVSVGCISELAVAASLVELPTELPTENPTGDIFGRPYVEGSVRAQGDFIYYRPILAMMVTGWSTDTDEWGSRASWSISLEEV